MQATPRNYLKGRVAVITGGGGGIGDLAGDLLGGPAGKAILGKLLG